MKRLSPDECIYIGTFRKPYGIGGSLLLDFDPTREASLENARVLMTGTDGLPVPWFVADQGIQILSSGTARVDLEWIEDDHAARKLCGMKVFLKESALVAEEDKPEKQENLVGYTITDREKGFAGVVTAQADYSGNLVLTVISGDRELLLPYHDDFLREADHSHRSLLLCLPEGLLDL